VESQNLDNKPYKLNLSIGNHTNIVSSVFKTLVGNYKLQSKEERLKVESSAKDVIISCDC